MQAPVAHKILGETCWLSAHRSLFWEGQNILVLSDMHLGKTGHFRKAGIAVPQAVLKEDMQRLLHLLQYFKPQRLLVVGDMFHSRANNELQFFTRWREQFGQVQFTLVRGNHDILANDWYASAGIEVIESALHIGKFTFTHDYCHSTDGYSFCGHIHPGVTVHGAGKQSLRFPCFYFGANHCILPAFGKFTGLATVHPQPGDAVYAVVEDSLVPIHHA